MLLAARDLQRASTVRLDGGWECGAVEPGRAQHPHDLEHAAADWIPATVPGTVASALKAAGRWDFDRPIDMDAFDWWFRTEFSVASAAIDHPCRLEFDGLATSAEVWLNGERILAADNMFRSYAVDVSSTLAAHNELVIVFRSLHRDLERRRPRPRWKTNLVSHQQLRWQRTALVGRIPGWSPPVPPVGPWRAMRLDTGLVQLCDRRIVTHCDGENGQVSVDVRLRSAVPILSAELRLDGTNYPLDISELVIHAPSLPLQERGHCPCPISPVGERVRERGSRSDDDRSLLTPSSGLRPPSPPRGRRDEVVTVDEEGFRVTGEITVPHPPLWWPHTHGKPNLAPCELVVTSVDHEEHRFPCGEIGFRALHVDTRDGGFGLRINHTPIFCRGACWTVADAFTLAGTEAQIERDLRLARDAGVNMLRVVGTMTYESDAFYQCCDRLGILVWQDFPFANMDYPVGDEEFRRNIAVEATQQLRRLSVHPSVAVYCGNSEVEQQAAMLGLPRACWRNEWFGEELPELCAAEHPGTTYVSSTPTGGALPFQPDHGLTHYYGVGAYLRPIEDIRRADVRFTPECLGFSQIPEPAMLEQITKGSRPIPHSPQWKQRVPRDTGAGWDFEDVRDHYLQDLFGVDPIALRSRDLSRYLELSRIVPGEMMARAFAEWRSGHSRTQGALVWFFKDLWPAAGWGIIDADGSPKAAYYYLKRQWRRRQLTLTDEGLNGLHLHLTNETQSDVDGMVEVLLLREPNTVIARERMPIMVAARSRRMVSADEILGRFHDVSYAYRFGPPSHHVVVATWFDEEESQIGEAHHVIDRCEPAMRSNSNVEASACSLRDGRIAVRLNADGFLHAVRLSAPGYLPDDNYFPLVPGREKLVHFEPWDKSPGSFRAEFEALNLDAPREIPIRSPV